MSDALRIIPSVKHRAMRKAGVGKTPYGLKMIDSCVTCPVHKDRLFCNLPAQALARFDAISSSAMYPRGAVLFVEGQEPRGVFVICSGRVKLTASAADGKSIILRIADPGEIVGLPATLSGRPYELSAEALEPIQANFVPRADFVKFLTENGEATLKVAEMLTDIYHALSQEVRYLGLSHSAEQKLARFLVDLAGAEAMAAPGAVRVTLTLTHQEISEMVGSSRETVTRLFAGLKKKGLIETHGSTLFIKDPRGLRTLAVV
jgi:CRP/FNR family transcriptional regulator, cyclic AMP receptor protein